MFNQYRETVSTALRAVSGEKISEAARILSMAKSQHSSVYIIGNGGSAATAMHLANDLVKVCRINAVGLPAMFPMVTAFGNDEGWENMYSHALRAMVLPQDILFAISCSGNSPNVVESVKVFKEINVPSLKTVVLTGADVNCKLARLIPTVMIYVPYKDIRVQEDCHAVICHAILDEIG